MDRRLYEASLRGDVSSLMKLLEEDRLVLDKLILTDFYGTTPLHIAAMRSHVDFAAKLLSVKPQLSFKLDAQGFYPLHLAAAENDVEMVKELLKANPNVCIETDKEGRTPLHIAAMQGQVEIMKILIETQPGALKERLPCRGETILHFCVNHNRLEALKFLVEHLLHRGVHIDDQEDSDVSVNSKDNVGNTILHLAVARRQMKMVKYLLDSEIGVELNAVNNKGFTARDILTSQGETNDSKDLEDLLRGAGVLALSSRQQLLESGDCDQKEQQPRGLKEIIVGKKKMMEKQLYDDEQYDIWVREKQNTLMLVASLIATIAFQGAVNPPGGVWQGDPKDFEGPRLYHTSIHETVVNAGSPTPSSSKHTSGPTMIGTSVLALTNYPAYISFLSFNTVGFLASLSIIFLLISGLHIKRQKFMIGILMGVLWVSVTFMALTYYVAVTCVTEVHRIDWDSKVSIDLKPVTITLYVWFGLMGIVLFVHFMRFIRWMHKNYFKQTKKPLLDTAAESSATGAADPSWLKKKMKILRRKKLDPVGGSSTGPVDDDPSSII